MTVIQEINAMVKKADPTWNRGLWDWLSSPLTCLYAKQNENFKAEQAEAAAKAKAEADAKAARMAAAKKTAPRGKDSSGDLLREAAQSVSNAYAKGSPARPAYISGGKVIAR